MHKAKKQYGQNFLTDKNLLKKIVSEANLENKNVIEVGPGKGALTQFILPIAKKFVAYEIDKSLKEYLDPLIEKGLTIKYGDFLNSDLNEDIKTFFNNEEVEFIGNLPYYITSPILFKVLETTNIRSATMMVQKEVGDRMVSAPNQKTYNALSVLVQYFTNVRRVMVVKKNMFIPQPKVDSVIIQIIKKPTDEHVTEKFVPFVKAAFNQKRKTLVNNLSQTFNIEKAEIHHFLKENQIDVNIRAEQISVEKFIELSKKWPF
ncbi:MAG: 16S rRNA (adenine(1518)-N(6)/adenine(1519)-N(6))-dimethyltransferase RsmA [Candidatus Phytoplasma sp.]|nr:16S rRNA (adenine(1518)-N(6)/adenine(1519)-N(6))-dimethyltransferase RsmA [Phytoplasma sp.]